MRLKITQADDRFVSALLPLLQTPVILIDLRNTERGTIPWQGEDLPVYHSYDALAGLCDWEDALYDTEIEGVQAVYSPPADTKRPEKEVPIPFAHYILLSDEEDSAEEEINAHKGPGKAAALWNGQQSLLDRLLSIFRGSKA